MSDWPQIVLDVLTIGAIGVAIWQGIVAQRLANRGFLFEAVRQVPTLAPLLVADFRNPTPDEILTHRLARDMVYLVLINRGAGVGTGIRAAYYLGGQQMSAAGNTITAMRPGDVEFLSPVAGNIDQAGIAKLRIWCDDVWETAISPSTAGSARPGDSTRGAGRGLVGSSDCQGRWIAPMSSAGRCSGASRCTLIQR